MSRLSAFTPQNVAMDLGPLAATGTSLQGMTGGPGDIPILANAYNTAYQGALGLNSQMLQNRQRLGEQLGADVARSGQGVLDAYGGVTQGGRDLAAQQAALGQGVVGGFQGVTQGGVDLRAQAAGQNADIFGRYGGLSDQVLGDIAGIEQSRAQDINTQYARDAASAQQSLISRGLGDSTSLVNVNRGLQSDRDRSRTNLANEIAGLRAGYRSNLGLAGLSDLRRGQEQGVNLGRDNLAYQARGVQEQGRQQDIQRGLGQDVLGFQSQEAGELARQQGIQTGMGQDFLRFVESIQAPYPSAEGYMSLAQQIGSTGQAGQDRAAIQNAIGSMQRTADTAGGAGGMTAAVPTSGGGFMGGTGRGLSGPEANYSGNVVYGGGSALGTAPGVPPLAQMQATPPLQGAGGWYGPAGMTWDQAAGSIDYSGGFSPEVAAGGFGMSGGDLNYGMQSSGDLFMDEYEDDFGGFGFEGGGFFG